jgi:tripartite-type tricarboxylate transporter receptor subunit TctC
MRRPGLRRASARLHPGYKWRGKMEAYVGCIRFGIASLCVLALAAGAQAQSYPQKPVRIISDAAAGSAPDTVARFVADGLGKAFGQQVIVVNQPGAGGSIAARVASEAVPDGYTLFLPSLSTFVALPGAAPNLPLELPRDFLPIGFADENPMFIAVSPSLGVKTLPELIALAKKRPGEISIAATGIGRLTHLTGELLQLKGGIQFLTVPYTGGPANAMSDISAGRVNVIIEGFSGIAAGIRAGLAVPIAQAAAQRLPDFPDLPTVAETIPGFAATGWQALVAPKGTPDAIINKVSEDLRALVAQPELKEKLGKLGIYTRPMTPADLLDFVHAQQAMWKPVIEQIAAKSKG